MFCGTSSFALVDPCDDGDARGWSSARESRSRSRKGGRGASSSKNPYSSRGLDTFYAVLAELEARRQRIVDKVGEKGSMVRFEYSGSQWVPIVVRIPTTVELEEEKEKRKKRKVVKDHINKTADVQEELIDHEQYLQQQEKKKHQRRPSRLTSPSRPMTSPESIPPIQSPCPPSSSQPPIRQQELPPLSSREITAITSTPTVDEAARCLSRARCRTVNYVPPPCQTLRPLLVLALILACLAAFGRTFAICCTCAWWYLAPSPTPTSMVESGGGRWWMKNSKSMDYTRRSSGKSLATFRSFPSLPQERATSSGIDGGFISPPKQRPQLGSLSSLPKERRLNSLLSPPKKRSEQLAAPPAPAKCRHIFNRRGGSSQLD